MAMTVVGAVVVMVVTFGWNIKSGREVRSKNVSGSTATVSDIPGKTVYGYPTKRRRESICGLGLCEV